MLIISEQNDSHQIVHSKGFAWFFQTLYAYLNERDKVRECYSCLKIVTQAQLHVDFSTIFIIKRASLKRFYLYMKLFQ